MYADMKLVKLHAKNKESHCKSYAWYFSCLIHLISKDIRYEPGHNISYMISFVPSEDVEQSAHPHKLVKILTPNLKMHGNICYTQNALQRLWSDWNVG